MKAPRPQKTTMELENELMDANLVATCIQERLKELYKVQFNRAELIELHGVCLAKADQSGKPCSYKNLERKFANVLGY